MADATTEPRVSARQFPDNPVKQLLWDLYHISMGTLHPAGNWWDWMEPRTRVALEQNGYSQPNDLRATIASQAEALAAKEAENAALREAVAILPNKIESDGVTPRPPGNSDWWATAVAERRQRKAAEAVLKAAREALEEIHARHIGDQPAAMNISDAEWARRQHMELRLIARAALTALRAAYAVDAIEGRDG